jgi:hypothetical protein
MKSIANGWAVRALALCAGALSLCAVSSCNYVGPAYLLIHGPDKTPAVFTLEKERPTVIFVDDRASVLPRRALRQQIGTATQNVLLRERALTNVIDTSAAMTAAAHETAGEPMDLISLAKAVQAEVVVYVTVDSYRLTADGQSYSPEGRYHVKVIDIKKQNPRVWPPEHEGYPVNVLMKPTSASPPKNAGEQTTALNALADRSGTAIAQLFFKHEAREEIAN